MKNKRLAIIIKELEEILSEVEEDIAINLINLDLLVDEEAIYAIKDAELCSMADAIDMVISILKDAIE